MPSNDSVTYLGVVMAGGSGERFWPLSRRTRPKQLLPLTHPGETMLGEAVSRLVPLIPRNRIFVITNPALVASIRDSDVVLPDENVVAEPCRRNTAGALIYMAALFLARYGGDGSNLVLAVSTADHLIPDKDSFLMCFREAMRAAEKLDGLMTIGLAPSRPETGYGYIQATGAPVGGLSDEVDIHRVSSFHEKPNRERA